MKKRKITTGDVITSTRYLSSFSGDLQRFVDGTMSTHQVTPEFIMEFRDFINTDNFSKSYMLKKSLVDKFPDYFVSETFLNNINPNSIIDMEMLAEYVDNIKVKFESQVTEEGEDSIIEKIIINSINNATSEEIENTNIVTLVSEFGNKVDEVLLRRVHDDTAKDMITLAIELRGGNSTSSTAMKYMSNDTKEDMLGTENVNVKTFLKYLSESKDIGWVIKMVNKVSSGEIKLEKTTEVFDNDIIRFLATAPESLVLEILKLRKFMPNALSYKVLLWALKNRSFNEDELISVKDVFKQAGLFFELKRFAKDMEYSKLLSLL